ncbi:hypothetical protein EDB89DRAFT_2081293 [Lactarius sanguifluus]|nr:hypothetical protein EDB89DRAFT_2081293 [Lactarius sanguifluus]
MSFHLTFPPSVILSKLDGTNWQTWTTTFMSLMLMNGCSRHLTHSNPGLVPQHPAVAAGAVGPTGPMDEGLAILALWAKQEEVITGLLFLSVMLEVLSSIISMAVFPTVHDKFQQLEHLYGQVGSMATFNLWAWDAYPLTLGLLHQLRRDRPIRTCQANLPSNGTLFVSPLPATHFITEIFPSGLVEAPQFKPNIFLDLVATVNGKQDERDMYDPFVSTFQLDAKAIEVMLIGFEPESKGYKLWDRQTRSVRLSRDVTFDESSFPSLQGVETHPTPTQVASPPPPVSVIAVPSTSALPPQRAPSPAHSNSSEEEDVEDLLDPKPECPHMPPPPAPPSLPVTPKCEQPTPTSPPPHQGATRIMRHVPPPSPDMPGGFEDCAQHSQLLREMDNAPRCSARAPVPNPRYFTADNMAMRGRRLGYAELLAAAYIGRDPASYAEAMRSVDADGTTACHYEMDAVTPPQGR